MHLALSGNPSSYRTGARGCCTLEDARDARRAADVIGIPFYVWDMAERFHADVVEDFVAEYARGNTPNPCLRCNEKIKFAAVLDRAVALGFDAVCTGHHARLQPASAAGRPRLAPQRGPGKDQSYVLAVLTSEQLSRAMFPLGDTTKDAGAPARPPRAAWPSRTSRTATTSASSPTATPGASCRGQLGAAPGQIVDAGGHRGRHATTAATASPSASARGCGSATRPPDGRPRYVLDIEPVSGTVTVGPAEALDVREIEADRPVWTGCPPPPAPLDCLVQLRAHGEAHPASLPAADGRRLGLRIRLREPGPRRRPGQAAVLYDGDVVLGSATDHRHRPRGRRARPSGGLTAALARLWLSEP